MKASLSADSAPADPDDELLVAYLDGELPRSECTDLENRLLGEETLRSRLTQLQSSWDMLDVLAVDGSGTSLVETTLEMAINDVKSHSAANLQARHESKSSWRSSRTLKVLMACALAAVAASLVAAFQARQTYLHQLRDLAIAEDFDAYNHGGNLDLMRTLAANPDWLEVVETAAELAPESSSELPLSQVSLAEREAAIERMSADERQRLGSRWDALNRLSKADRDSIRELASAVDIQPDRATLLETMQAYALWRSRLPSELVDQIEGDDVKLRRQAIQDAIDVSKSSIAKQAGSQLDDESVDVIYFALQEFARKRIPKDQRTYTPPGGFRGPLENPATREWFAIRQLFGYTVRRQPAKRDQDSTNGGESKNRRDTSLTPRELATIESLLPDKSRDMLNTLTGGDPTLASMTLQIWVEEVIRRKLPHRSRDSLIERYQKLSEDQREVIDLMPPEKMLQELSSGRLGRR